MYYIKVEENELVKYEITLEENKLKAIKLVILYNCGMIEHHDYEATNCKHEEYDEHIANFSSNFSKTIDRDYSDVTYYRYTYDYYLSTPLTNLIDELLKGNACAYKKL